VLSVAKQAKLRNPPRPAAVRQSRTISVSSPFGSSMLLAVCAQRRRCPPRRRVRAACALTGPTVRRS